MKAISKKVDGKALVIGLLAIVFISYGVVSFGVDLFNTVKRIIGG